MELVTIHDIRTEGA